MKERDQYSEHFYKDEFICKCGKCKSWDMINELIFALEELREHFDQPIKIESGYRCKSYNRKVGGKKRSKHLIGIAADFIVKNVDPKEVYLYLFHKYPDTFGIGKYKNFTHLDVRYKRARW